MPEKVIMSENEIHRALVRLAHEAVESINGCDDLVIIGIHTRGVPLAHRIAVVIKGFRNVDVPVGALDIGRYRDDIPYLDIQPVVRPSDIPTSITGKNVVLVDDVLFI